MLKVKWFMSPAALTAHPLVTRGPQKLIRYIEMYLNCPTRHTFPRILSLTATIQKSPLFQVPTTSVLHNKCSLASCLLLYLMLCSQKVYLPASSTCEGKWVGAGELRFTFCIEHSVGDPFSTLQKNREPFRMNVAKTEFVPVLRRYGRSECC